MKFLAGLAIAASLARSAAAAASVTAPVYILRKPEVAAAAAAAATAASPATAPELPPQIARQIMMQRLHMDDQTSLLEPLPDNFSPELALELLNQYGVPASPLFAAETAPKPTQIVVIVQDVNPDAAKKLVKALPTAFQAPAFTVADPPSNDATSQFVTYDLRQWATEHSFGEPFYPAYYVENAGTGKTMNTLVKGLEKVQKAVEQGNYEALVILLPKSGRGSKTLSWTRTPMKPYPKDVKLCSEKCGTGVCWSLCKTPEADQAPSELRRRGADSEAVMADDVEGSNNGQSSSPMQAEDGGDDDDGSSSGKSSLPMQAEDGDDTDDSAATSTAAVPLPTTALPSCFLSYNACSTQTRNCSGHGVCIDKYAASSSSSSSSDDGEIVRRGDDTTASCFVCHCYSTLNRPENDEDGQSTTHWAGAMCQKKDVSVPFWLITGFTVTIVGAVSFAIGLLFSVGEEKLPGVIGAGVSRTK